MQVYPKTGELPQVSRSDALFQLLAATTLCLQHHLVHLAGLPLT